VRQRIKAVSLPERWVIPPAVLADMGYSAAEVESMIERNIASLGWAGEFLPS
jgi:hypothetical protein